MDKILNAQHVENIVSDFTKSETVNMIVCIQEERESWRERAIAAESERDELKAKLAEIEAQEPDFYVDPDGKDFEGYGSLYKSKETDTCIPVWLNAKPSKPIANNTDAAQRITEQDAREIIKDYVGYLDNRPTAINSWLDQSGRTLLAKLNEHREPVAKFNDKLISANELVSLLRKVWKHGFDAEHYDDIDYCNDVTIAQSDESFEVTANKAEVPEYVYELVDVIKNLMDWQVKHVDAFDNYAYNDAAKLLKKLPPLPPLKDGE